MIFLQLHSESICFVSAICFSLVMLIEFNVGNSLLLDTLLAGSALVYVIFVIVFSYAVLNCNVLISSGSATILKVENKSISSTHITYAEQDGTLGSCDYSGPIRLDTTLNQPTGDVEIYKNIFGDKASKITNLVVPKL